MTGLNFWVTNYCVSTAGLGLNEEMIKKPIRDQDHSDK